MKKVLFLVIATGCLFSFSSMAQKAQVGISSGVNFSNVYGQIGGADTRGDVRAGFTAGLVVDAPFGKKKFFSFQPAIHYVQKGRFTTRTDVVREADALRYTDLILNFVHYAWSKSKTKIYFGLGPQLGFNLPSKKMRITDEERSEIRSINFGNEASHDYRGIDWGANALAGLRFKNGITFSVNYTFGLRNLLPEPLRSGGNDHLRNGAAGIRLGYFFKNPKP